MCEGNHLSGISGYLNIKEGRNQMKRDPLSLFLYILAIVVVVWLLLEIVARI